MEVEVEVEVGEMSNYLARVERRGISFRSSQ